MGETGNHHLWVIPGARYVWSSQRYESDTFWTIDLATMEVVDKFPLSMGDKKVIAPLHVGFAYTQPLAVVGNILDKEHGYLTLMSTVTRRPIDIVEISCHGARDAMFTLDDSKIFTSCQQNPRGMAVIDVATRKEIKMDRDPRRTGRRDDPRRQVLHGGRKGRGRGIRHRDDGARAEHRGSGWRRQHHLSQADSSKCYAGRRNAEAVAVLDMADPDA